MTERKEGAEMTENLRYAMEAFEPWGRTSPPRMRASCATTASPGGGRTSTGTTGAH